VTLAREDASKGADAALDPWAPLDPHETEGMGEAHAPFKKLTTYKVRQLLPCQTCCPCIRSRRMSTEFLGRGLLMESRPPLSFLKFSPLLLKGPRASGPAAQGRGQGKDGQTQGARPVLGVLP
jgi:hypothetical protein